MKILFCDARFYNQSTLNTLEKYYELTKKNFKSNNEFANYLKKKKNFFSVIFLTLGFSLNQKTIDKYQKKIKYICSPTTGTNHININSKLIKVISLKNILNKIKNVSSTAELTWLLILMIQRNLFSFLDFIKKKDNDWLVKDDLIGNSLNNKNILIIGPGRIGKQVNRYAKSFNMNVLQHGDKDSIKSLKVKLTKADIVTIHINYKKDNINFFNKSLFSKMKQNSILINTSRGELIDENQLLKFLKNKRIKGAALDVLKNENKLINSKIIKYYKKNKNLILTPHIGGSTYESFEITRNELIKYFIKKYVN